MAREKLGRGYRPLPLAGQRGGTAEGILQQPGSRGRDIQGHHLRESAAALEVQVPGHLRRPRARREQDEEELHEGGVPARQTGRKALRHQGVPRKGDKRHVYRMVHQTAGVRERENERVLLHGEQQAAGPFFPAGVPAHHQRIAGRGRYPCTSRGTRRRKRTRPHVSRRTWNPSTAKGTSSSTRRKRTTRT